MDSEKSLIPLATMIADLRNELLTALSEGVGKELRFRLKPVELELSLVVTKKGKIDGKVGFWVIDVKGGGEYDNAATQKLKLTLEPVGKDGRSTDVLISDSNARRD